MFAVVPKNGHYRNLQGYSTESKEFDNQCEITRAGSSLSKNTLNWTWKQTVNSSAMQRQNSNFMSEFESSDKMDLLNVHSTEADIKSIQKLSVLS